jgi:peroxiredoxin
LAAFQRATDKLTDEGIRVIAASTDPLEKARETVAEHALSYPVGYGLPLKETAATLGAFYEERRGVLQSTGYVVRPDATIAVAQYSSGPIGRLVWQDVLGLVQHYKKQA